MRDKMVNCLHSNNQKNQFWYQWVSLGKINDIVVFLNFHLIRKGRLRLGNFFNQFNFEFFF